MAKKKKGKLGTKVKEAGIVATAAGWYFLYASPSATKNRKKVKAWMLKAKGDVLEQMEKHRNGVDKKKYNEIVDKVSKRYKRLSSVSNKELSEMQKELKKHWGTMSKELGPEKRAVKRTAKKVSKKVKKVVKKRKK